VYEGENYTPASPLNYLERSRERLLMHPQTLRELTYILTMLRDEGEEATFAHVRKMIKAKQEY
jgi:hypothetical protein